MFRLWGRIWKDNHMLKATVICDDRQETRTHKVFHCLEQICYELDLGNPIWLDTPGIPEKQPPVLRTA